MSDIFSPCENQLHGTWAMIRAEYAGEEAPETVASHTTVEFSDAGYRVRFSGQIVDEGTLKVNPADPAKKLVLVGTSGTNKGCTLPCIYQLVGDRLRVCYGIDGIPPLDFTTRSGQNRYLATYRRAHL